MKKPNAMFGVAFLLGTRQFDPDVFSDMPESVAILNCCMRNSASNV